MCTKLSISFVLFSVSAASGMEYLEFTWSNLRYGHCHYGTGVGSGKFGHACDWLAGNFYHLYLVLGECWH